MLFSIKNPKVKRSKAQVKEQEEKELEELERIDREVEQFERMGRPPSKDQQEEVMRWLTGNKEVERWISVRDDF